MSNAALGDALNGRRATTDTNLERRRDALMAVLRNAESDFKAAMPDGRDAALLIHDISVTLREKPELLNADPNTLVGAAMTCAQLGLRVGLLGHAWITLGPDDVAQFVIGYQGLRELAMRSGLVADVYARPVFGGDYLDVDFGTRNVLVHKPPTRGERGTTATDYYAVAHYTSGGHAFEVMTLAQVERHRDTWAPRARTEDGSDGPVIGPWVEHFDAMAAKTVFKRLAKWMPKSPDMAAAIEADNRVRVDRDPLALGTGYLPQRAAPAPSRPTVTEQGDPDQ